MEYGMAPITTELNGKTLTVKGGKNVSFFIWGVGYVSVLCDCHIDFINNRM